MLLCDFKKNIFYGTELPIIEETSHTYKTKGNNVRKKGRSHQETYMQSKRISTAHRYPDETYNSDNGLLLAKGNLKLNIDPYLNHYNNSGWQSKPEGKGWHSSEKNDDRRTRTPWVYELEKKKWREKTRRSALNAIKRMLFRRRVDGYSWSQKPNYKYMDKQLLGPGEG